MRAELKPLWASAVATGAIITGLAAPTAAQAYSTPVCHGATAAGIGSSLQKVAQLGIDGTGNTSGWAHAFSGLSNSVCSGPFDAKPTYAPLGSGAALTAFCSDGVNLNTAYDFGAVDDAATSAQLNNMNNCSGFVNSAGHPANNLHTIPVAQAAIGIAVHLPTGCTINSKDFASTGNRFSMLNANLEKLFLNDGSVTWATLLPNSPGCSGPITRAVRYDQSGTTYQTENYLAQIGDASTWTTAANAYQPQNWPNHGSNIRYGGTTQNPSVCTLTGPGSTPPNPESAAQKSACNGAGNVAQVVLDTPGSIGYVDMSTLIAKGFQYGAHAGDFWVPVQHNGTGTKGATFADPNVNSNGYLSGQATGGANCASSSYTPPTAPGGTSDPTLASWSNVIGSNPNQSDYPACTLTFEMAWDAAVYPYGNSAAVDARQRSVKDYLTYLTDNSSANDGQSVLRGLDYDALPSSLLSIAKTGVASIHYP